MQFTKNTLNANIVPVFVVLLLVVIVVVTAVFAYGRSKDSARTDALEKLDIIATDREFRLNQFVDDQLQEIVRISRIPTIRDISDELLGHQAGTPAFQAAYDTLERFLQSVAANSPNLSEFLLLTDDGDVFFSTNKANEGTSGADSDYFSQGRLGSVIQNVHPSANTGAPTITVATPLIDNRGGRLGVMAAHVNLSSLYNIFGDLTGLGNTGELYLVDTSSRFLSAEGFGTEDFPGAIASEGIDAATGGRPGSGQYRNYANESVVGIYRWLPDREIALLAEVRTSEVFAPARRLGFIVLLAGLGVVALIALGWFLLMRQMRKAATTVRDPVVNFSGYDIGGFYDETIDSNGQPRAGSALLTGFVEDLPAGQLLRHQRAAEQAFTRLGINFNVYGDESGVDRIWPFDIVPRIVEASDWAYIERGLKQRIHVLNTFINDIYHDQRIVKDGVIPAHMIQSARNLLPACMGVDPPKGIWCHITGTDLVRDGSGKMFVLEDNLRCPSGVSYVLENRQVLKGTFPQVFEASRVRPVDDYPSRLLEMLRYLAPEGASTPVVVLLTPGIYNSAYFEHAFLAQQMGIELVEGRDLTVSDGYVMMRTTQGMQRVDVIYRRIDDDFLDPLVFRSDSQLGVPGLMDVFREGRVALANAPGTGIADDKAIYA